MREKDRSYCSSVLLILIIITLGLTNVQGYAGLQPGMTRSDPIPPPPSSPSWTYVAGSVVYAVAVSADGHRIVTAGSSDTEAHVFARDGNSPVLNYSVIGGAVTIAISASGNTTVVGTNVGFIQVFGNQSNTPLWSFSGEGALQSVAVSADGNTIAGGNNNGYIYVFSRQSNVSLWTYRDDSGSASVYSVAISKNGSTVVAGFMTGRYDVCVFSRQSNTSIWTYYAVGRTRSVAVSEDGNTIASATAGNLTLFSRHSNQTIWNYATGKIVYGVAVSADGSTIAEGGGDGFLRVFNRTSDAPVVAGNTTGAIYHAIALSSDGAVIACGNTGPNHRAFLYSKALGRQLWNYTIDADIDPIEYNGPAVGISSDGSVTAYGCVDHKLYVFLYDMVPPVLGDPLLSEFQGYHNDQNNNYSFTISVSDNFGVASVVMYYRIGDSSPWKSAAMNLAGKVYKAWIGRFLASSNLSYYINATDTSGNSACLPANAPTNYYWLTLPPHQDFWDFPFLTIIFVGIAAFVVITIVVYLLRYIFRTISWSVYERRE